MQERTTANHETDPPSSINRCISGASGKSIEATVRTNLTGEDNEAMGCDVQDAKPGTALRLAFRPRDAARALGIGERLLWSLTNRGEIPHTKVGRAILYPVKQLSEWLESRAREGVRK